MIMPWAVCLMYTAAVSPGHGRQDAAAHRHREPAPRPDITASVPPRPGPDGPGAPRPHSAGGSVELPSCMSRPTRTTTFPQLAHRRSRIGPGTSEPTRLRVKCTRLRNSLKHVPMDTPPNKPPIPISAPAAEAGWWRAWNGFRIAGAAANVRGAWARSRRSSQVVSFRLLSRRALRVLS